MYNLWGIRAEVAELYYKIMKDCRADIQRQMSREAIEKLGGLELKIPNQIQSKYINFKPANYIALPRSRCEGHC